MTRTGIMRRVAFLAALLLLGVPQRPQGAAASFVVSAGSGEHMEISGDEVTLKCPPNTNQQGQQTTTLVTLRRLSGEEAMLPSPSGGRECPR